MRKRIVVPAVAVTTAALLFLLAPPLVIGLLVVALMLCAAVLDLIWPTPSVEAPLLPCTCDIPYPGDATCGACMERSEVAAAPKQEYEPPAPEVMSVEDVRTIAFINRRKPQLTPLQAERVIDAVNRRLAQHDIGMLELAPDVKLSLPIVVSLLHRVRDHAHEAAGVKVLR